MKKEAQYSPISPAVFHILMALADGEKHGYGIMKDVEQQTNSVFRMGPGTLYGSIKRMLSTGLIEESGERPDAELDDERRRYYRLTGVGRSVAIAEADRLAMAVRLAKRKHLLSSFGASE
jgi:DNA-binding PadR family transcriptional regulator